MEQNLTAGHRGPFVIWPPLTPPVSHFSHLSLLSTPAYFTVLQSHIQHLHHCRKTSLITIHHLLALLSGLCPTATIYHLDLDTRCESTASQAGSPQSQILCDYCAICCLFHCCLDANVWRADGYLLRVEVINV